MLRWQVGVWDLAPISPKENNLFSPNFGFPRDDVAALTVNFLFLGHIFGNIESLISCLSAYTAYLPNLPAENQGSTSDLDF